MSTAVLVPLADYLGHTTDPDCEYLEGRLVERNVGEISHGDAQGRTRQRAWIHTPQGAREALDRILRNPAGDLEVLLSAVFPGTAAPGTATPTQSASGPPSRQ